MNKLIIPIDNCIENIIVIKEHILSAVNVHQSDPHGVWEYLKLCGVHLGTATETVGSIEYYLNERRKKAVIEVKDKGLSASIQKQFIDGACANESSLYEMANGYAKDLDTLSNNYRSLLSSLKKEQQHSIH